MAMTRLQKLSQQLYGKEETSVVSSQSSDRRSGYSVKIDPVSQSSSKPIIADSNYLTRDLIKIILIATLLITIQFIVKYLLKI